MSDTSDATIIAAAITTDLESEYSDYTVRRSYAPIYDIGQQTPGETFITIYESTTEAERVHRNAGNEETHVIQIGIQHRFDFGAEDQQEVADTARKILQDITRRYHGKKINVGNDTFRASQATYAAVNDPAMTWQQGSYFGVVELTFRLR